MSRQVILLKTVQEALGKEKNNLSKQNILGCSFTSLKKTNEICLNSQAKDSSDELIRKLCCLKHIIHYFSSKILSVSSYTKIISWYKSLSHCQ